MVSVTYDDGDSNATLDGGRGLCFPLRDANHNRNVYHVVGRVSSVPFTQLQVEVLGSYDVQHTAQLLSSLDTEGEVCMGGKDKHNPRPVSILTESVRCVKGDGKKDPTARACERTTGPISRVVGPVPTFQCSIICPYCDGNLVGPSGNPCTLCVNGTCVVGRFVEDPLLYGLGSPSDASSRTIDREMSAIASGVGDANPVDEVKREDPVLYGFGQPSSDSDPATTEVVTRYTHRVEPFTAYWGTSGDPLLPICEPYDNGFDPGWFKEDP